MIRFGILILVVCLFQSCNNSKDKKLDSTVPLVDETESVSSSHIPASPAGGSEEDPLDSIDREQRAFLENTNYYVLAPRGLSLRKKSDLKSDRIKIMPKGSTLKMTEAMYTIDTIINHIPGSMVAVEYQGENGYAYSGYLTKYYVPSKPMLADDYINIVQSEYPNVTYNEQENEPDFHEGYNGDLTLPSCDWHEAYYIASALYGIPESLGFPSNEGEKSETISQPDKPEDTWISDLHISRNNKRLDTLHYIFRAEGYGWQVKIMAAKNNAKRIEHVAFVD